MADDRERFGQLLCRIWDDEDWKGLSPRGQWFYALLVSQANLNRAGVIALTTRRWAKFAQGPNVAEQIASAMTELVNAEFIVVDHDTEELLVRSLMRNGGLIKYPNVLKRALREATEVLSPRLRAVLVVELRRLKHPDADLAADAIEKGEANPFPKGYSMHSVNPSVKGSANGLRKGSAKGSPEPGGRDKGSSSSFVGNSSSSRAEAAPKRGTKAPDHLLITPDMREWAKTKGVTVDLDEETEMFLDRHRSKGSVFKDWSAAWRTWMRNSVKFANERAGSNVLTLLPDEYSPPQAPREVVFDPDPTALQRWHAEQRTKWEAARGTP